MDIRLERTGLSDAKEWFIKLQQEDKKSFSVIHSIRGVVRPAFQRAVDDDILGMRISEFTGLTLKDLDMENRTINIDHQLQKTGTLVYIDTTKTYAGTRVISMQGDVYECFQNIIKARPKLKVEPIIDGYSGYLCFDKDDKPMVAMHWEKYFQHAVDKLAKKQAEADAELKQLGMKVDVTDRFRKSVFRPFDGINMPRQAKICRDMENLYQIYTNF